MPEIIGKIKRSAIADQVSYNLTVQYEGEDPSAVGFVGSPHGNPGPIVAISPAGIQTFVVNPGRFGDSFDESWVRNFFKEA